MTASLPAEIWDRIAHYLSQTTLKQLKAVNRMFYSIAHEQLCHILDLAPPAKTQEAFLNKLKMQVDHLRLLPLNTLKSVRVTPVPNTILIRSIFSPFLQLALLVFQEPPKIPLQTRLEAVTQQAMATMNAATGVRELHIIDQELDNLEMQKPSFVTQSWTLFSSRITVLSLQLFTPRAEQTCLPSLEDGTHFALPLLHTFRLIDLHLAIRRLLQHSALLEELDYQVPRYDYTRYPAATYLWFPDSPSLYPHLRRFKWHGEPSYLRPAPFYGLWPLLDFARIIELSKQGTIRTLELAGPVHRLFEHLGIRPSLTALYLPIHPDNFASKIYASLTQRFQSAHPSPTLRRWPLHDLGVVDRRSKLTPELTELLKLLASLIPSVCSLCGTGRMDLSSDTVLEESWYRRESFSYLRHPH
ncbi:hypothetical protein DL96DRAFT_1581697 [Flagelloscypha sp. PMI_526]|nr:hypothetical protein DL96DRAFT_1581697 [Flagelloscypha sp. PMI_526]